MLVKTNDRIFFVVMFLKAVKRHSVSKQLPLHLILIIPFVLQIFAIVGLTGYLTISNGYKAVNTVASELRNEISVRINQQILNYLEKPYIVNQTLASAISEGQINLTDVQGLEHYFWRLVNQNTVDFLQIATFEGSSVLIERLEEGFIVARTADKSILPNRKSYRLNNQGQRAEVLKIQTFDPHTRPWYKAALKAGQPTWSEIFLGSTGSSKATIALSEPIYSPTGKFLGVQNSNFRVSKIHEFLKSVKVGHTGQTFIIDKAGNLIASSVIKQPYKIKDSKLEQIPANKIENPAIRFTAQALFKRFGNLSVIKDNQQLDFLLHGKRQFVQVSPIQDGRGIDWLSVVVLPESDFMAQIHANTRTTILLCLAALAVAIVLGIYTSQWIARPIMFLSRASEAIARGALSQNVEIPHIRELGVLARSFNRMAQQLRESFTTLEQTNHQLEQRIEERTSELKNTLQNLQRAQAQMIAEKMSSLGQLVAGVAHEINNPINFIHGNVYHLSDYTHNLLELLQLYQTEFPNPTFAIQNKIDEIDLEFMNEDILKILSSMTVGTEQIREIVKSLRTFSRLDEAEVKQVDIHEGIETTLLILQHRLAANTKHPEIEVIRDYGNLPLIECYSGQLNQVFMNILINAIDAIEQLKAQPTSQEIKHNTSQITIRTSAINLDWVEIAIADNGLGMSEDVQQRIFEPFFTTKPVGKGTGMGLSISYQIIVDKHNGKLNCLSSLGEGTKFVIQIPVRQEFKLFGHLFVE
ncbi:HAMP domain-containing protein [Scytonema sp. UIC 10036]|uniref:ATP-binding protein n=1 Tax=Scytonema sp. UIC 10036 TaxID=2304196 RepID=UPI0012DA912B|nr:ATP-binding protein [Scytonema sp. UIC 10036]MUG91295.1 HAMP domain-containing protein [Scytonema sp. UIC 10036]